MGEKGTFDGFENDIDTKRKVRSSRDRAQSKNARATATKPAKSTKRYRKPKAQKGDITAELQKAFEEQEAQEIQERLQEAIESSELILQKNGKNLDADDIAELDIEKAREILQSLERKDTPNEVPENEKSQKKKPLGRLKGNGNNKRMAEKIEDGRVGVIDDEVDQKDIDKAEKYRKERKAQKAREARAKRQKKLEEKYGKKSTEPEAENKEDNQAELDAMREKIIAKATNNVREGEGLTSTSAPQENVEQEPRQEVAEEVEATSAEKTSKLKGEIDALNRSVQENTVSETLRSFGEKVPYDRGERHALVEEAVKNREVEVTALEQEAIETQRREQNKEALAEIDTLKAEIEAINDAVQNNTLNEVMERFGAEPTFDRGERHAFVESAVREREARIGELEEKFGEKNATNTDMSVEAAGEGKEGEKEGFDNRFETEFGISKENLEAIEGFEKLSLPQQKLLFENFTQMTLGSVREDAARLHTEAMGIKREEAQERYGKLLGNAVAGFKSFFTSTYAKGKQEKEVALRVREGGIGEHESLLTELITSMATYGPRVHENVEGELVVDLVNIRERARNKEVRDEEWFAMTELNQMAHELAKLPAEWGDHTLGVDTEEKNAFGSFIREKVLRSKEEPLLRAHKATYESARAKYEQAKVALEEVMRKSGKSDAEIAQALIGVDTRVHQLQTLQTNPDALSALDKIEDKNLFAEAGKNMFSASGGGYFALGFIGRSVAGFIPGYLGAPLVSAGVARMRSWDRTAAELRERDRNARKGVGDTKEGALNVVSAQALVSKTERLIAQVKQASSAKDKAKLLSSLSARVEYIHDKQQLNRVDYGERNGAVTTQTQLTEVLAEGLAILVSEEEAGSEGAKARKAKLEEKLEKQLEKREEMITKARQAYRKGDRRRSMAKAASFSIAGALVAEMLGQGGAKGESRPDAFNTNFDTNIEPQDGATALPNGAVMEPPQGARLATESVSEEITGPPPPTNEEIVGPPVPPETTGEPDVPTVEASEEVVGPPPPPEISSEELVGPPPPPTQEELVGPPVPPESTSGEIEGPPVPPELQPEPQTGEQSEVETEAVSESPEANTEAVVVPASEVTPESAELGMYGIEPGDTLIGIMKENIPAIDALLTEQAKNNAIANILNSLTEEELQSIGVRSGNVDLIYAGEEINLDALNAVIEEKRNFIDSAAKRFGGFVTEPEAEVSEIEAVAESTEPVADTPEVSEPEPTPLEAPSEPQEPTATGPEIVESVPDYVAENQNDAVMPEGFESPYGEETPVLVQFREDETKAFLYKGEELYKLRDQKMASSNPEINARYAQNLERAVQSEFRSFVLAMKLEAPSFSARGGKTLLQGTLSPEDRVKAAEYLSQVLPKKETPYLMELKKVIQSVLTNKGVVSRS